MCILMQGQIDIVIDNVITELTSNLDDYLLSTLQFDLA